MRPRAAFWTTRWTVQHIHNGLTVFALVDVIIRSLSSTSSPLTVAQGQPPHLSPQDKTFVAKCHSIYENYVLPSVCPSDPSVLCPSICNVLGERLNYYADLWPTTLPSACDAACNVGQSSICDSSATFLQFCEDIARARAQVSSPLVVAQDDQSCQSFFSHLVLFVVAASNILVFFTEYKAKDLVASHDDAALYEASRSDVTTSLISHLMSMNNAILAVFGELDKHERAVKGKELVDVTLPTMFRLLERRLVMISVGDPYLLEKLSLADLEVYLTVDMLKTNFLRDIDTSTIPDGYTHVMRIYNAVKEHPKVAEWNHRKN
ncbi:hypothetical protein AC1031_012154 [Aphanomyces cochlioides]|nr:hypothetical protein AC1031_012154 [Aphanomyces cochlioides]